MVEANDSCGPVHDDRPKFHCLQSDVIHQEESSLQDRICMRLQTCFFMNACSRVERRGKALYNSRTTPNTQKNSRARLGLGKTTATERRERWAASSSSTATPFLACPSTYCVCTYFYSTVNHAAIVGSNDLYLKPIRTLGLRGKGDQNHS
jgi:hypothetical protein